MAQISTPVLTIDKETANAHVTVTYIITWSGFDQATNLPYLEEVLLIGDDTGQDGDDHAVGDDKVALVQPPLEISSNGQPSTPRERKITIAFDKLVKEDEDLTGAANNDDEIRAWVKLSPRMPRNVIRESAVFDPTQAT